MVKKLKAMAEGKNDNQLASAIKESASQIWLAGLGAFAKAQEEGSKVFEALVKEGTGIQMRSKSFTEDKIGEVTGRVTKAAGDVAKQATQSWDKLESVFEDRVSRAMSRLGVPSKKEMQGLIARVEELTASVQALGGKPIAAKRAAKGAGTRAAKASTAKTDKVAKAPAKRARKAA
jgi:poly(hydroxyalkanoate) granule-associated protein